MEVRETAACGISERKFAIEFDSDDLPHIYRILRYVISDDGYYDEEFLEDLKEQMIYICGADIEEEPGDDANPDEIVWEEEDDQYNLIFTESAGSLLYQIFSEVEERGPKFRQETGQSIDERHQGVGAFHTGQSSGHQPLISKCFLFPVTGR